MEQKDELFKQDPQPSFKIVAKILKESFCRLNAEKKTLYMEKAAKFKEEKAAIEKAKRVYCFELKAELLKEQPQLSIKDVKTILEERFCNLNAEEKTLYMEKAAKFKEKKKLKLELK